MANPNNIQHGQAVRHSSTLPFEVFTSFWKHRDLIIQMTKREVLGRYRGSFLGIAWSFFHPIIMLAVYTFVFSVVFKVRLGLEVESKVDFAIVLFAGLIVYNLFSETINRAPGLIMSNINYVKKVLFPLEVLPVVATGSALFHAFVSLFVLLLFRLALNHTLPLTAIFFPLMLVPLILVTMGLAWFLASLGVYLRDLSLTIGMLTTALLFLSPIFYTASAVPEPLRAFFFLNPLTFIIEQARDVLIWGRTPDWMGLLLYAGLSLVAASGGLAWFQKTRSGFADVL